MNLSPNTLLVGKYMITSSLLDSDSYIMYMAKAPSLAEEFVIIEFFPKNIATRDDVDHVTVSPDDAEQLDMSLEKFAGDCRKLMHMSANRFWGIREVLNELGTAYAVAKKLEGALLGQFIAEMEPGTNFSENMTDSVYDSMRNIFKADISVIVSEEMIYVQNPGSMSFMFDYKPDVTEKEAIICTARILYTLITKKFYADGFDASLIPADNKYADVIIGALDSHTTVHSFADADAAIERNMRKYEKEAPFREYAPSLALLSILILVLIAAASFGAYQLALRLLG